MTDLDKFGVPKLGSDNYAVWFVKMQLLLTHKSLWEAIEKGSPFNRVS